MGIRTILDAARRGYDQAVTGLKFVNQTCKQFTDTCNAAIASAGRYGLSIARLTDDAGWPSDAGAARAGHRSADQISHAADCCSAVTALPPVSPA
jgi:hypothetical protein